VVGIDRKKGRPPCDRHRAVPACPPPDLYGIIAASYATAGAKGTLLAFAGASAMTAGWYLKARIEERFLRGELGQNAYGNYAARVPMLLPFAPL